MAATSVSIEGAYHILTLYNEGTFNPKLLAEVNDALDSCKEDCRTHDGKESGRPGGA